MRAGGRDYKTLAPNLDAYIFCMSTGNKMAPEQAILSQWRAYGQDGRGVCLTLEMAALKRLEDNTPGLRIAAVVYEEAKQVTIVKDILARIDRT